jgi:predicted deacylase
VLHGTKQPVVAVTMGVHGYEFPAILAGQALLPRIDPRTLTGTVVLVRLVHVEAFEGRTSFVNPWSRIENTDPTWMTTSTAVRPRRMNRDGLGAPR